MKFKGLTLIAENSIIRNPNYITFDCGFKTLTHDCFDFKFICSKLVLAFVLFMNKLSLKFQVGTKNSINIINMPI